MAVGSANDQPTAIILLLISSTSILLITNGSSMDAVTCIITHRIASHHDPFHWIIVAFAGGILPVPSALSGLFVGADLATQIYRDPGPNWQISK